MYNYGFFRVAAAVPRLRVANPEYNAAQIIELMSQAKDANCSLVVFPELSITGYTCGDLFGQTVLLNRALAALDAVRKASQDSNVVTVVGVPLEIKHHLYNCAVVLLNGRILGIVPKQYLSNQGEFCESRWFASGLDIVGTQEIKLLGQQVPFGKLIFVSEEEKMPVSFGVEIGEDLAAPIPPSSYMTLKGALLVVNLAASSELVTKADYRYRQIGEQSSRCTCGYIYSSAGVHESTTDSVYSGDCLIVENGELLARTERFVPTSQLIVAEIDIERLLVERRRKATFFASRQGREEDYTTVGFCYPQIPPIERLHRSIHPHPFVPENIAERKRRCEEIFNIQAAGLARRMEHTGAKYAVIGVSGGLDSTLALLVTAKAFDLLGMPRARILSVTMPGFATTSVTHKNALELAHGLRTTVKEIDIRAACLQHFKDIGHDANVHDITYENTQARERTQILMDLANKVGGLVIGTGDLSELALGWCTYNADHMSMYAVNTSVPKSLMKHLILWAAEQEEPDLADVLHRIVDTPISPELVPGKDSERIEQKTEDIIGPYELHDFFLYYMVRRSFGPRKILFLAEHAFAGKYSPETVRRWLTVFCRRFFSQQFKRSCLPDGPRVGSVSLSPRGVWRMPSDADSTVWLADITERENKI